MATRWWWPLGSELRYPLYQKFKGGCDLLDGIGPYYAKTGGQVFYELDISTKVFYMEIS